METSERVHDHVREYYGRVLSNRDDLKTGARCSIESLPAAHREILGMLDEEIMAKFCGCGSPIPPAIEGCTVLDLGCRVESRRRVPLTDPDVEAKAGMIDFFSLTIRAFKLPGLEDLCEDYGQTATYLGTIGGHAHRFALDDHHLFITGKPMLVCGNTAAMVGETRFAQHFRVVGDTSVHYCPFGCSPGLTELADGNPGAAGNCC